MSEISLSFQILSVHLSLPLYNFTQWKDKSASYSFTTKKLTHSLCQVSLVVKYSILFKKFTRHPLLVFLCNQIDVYVQTI